MSNENVELIRSAYEAYARGDFETVLSLIDPKVEWTSLDPSVPAQEP